MADHVGAGKNTHLFSLPVHPTKNLFSYFSRSRMGSLASLLLAASLCLIFSGCGGEEQPPPHVQATPQPTPPPAVTPAVEEEPEPEPEKDPAAEAPKEEVAKVEATPEPPPRPSDVAKWKKDDYLSAKKEGDRKLEAAVKLMAEKFQNDARAASLFKELLETQHLPAEKLPDGSPGTPKTVAVILPVANELVMGLGMNRTPEATAILKDLLFGKFETPLTARVALTNVLTEMVKYSQYQEYQDFVFGLLTQPQKTLNGAELVPDAPLTEAQLRGLILGLIDSNPTPELNVRLAKYLEDPEVTKALASDIETSLTRDKPDTLTAKLILYQNEQAEKRTISVTESSLLSHSENALSILLGLPLKLEERPAPGTVSRPTARQAGRSEEEMAGEMAFATECWTPELQSFLMQQIAKKADLTTTPGPLQMIASTPTLLARSNMSELITANAYLGPTSWSTAGLFGRALADPAFVILAKNVYHNPSRRPGRTTPDKDTQERWRDTMDPLIQVWFKRFYSAARNSLPEDWAAAKETGNFKVTFHRDAHVVAEYHLLWPGTAQAQIPNVALAPLEIHYVRLEDNAVPEKIISHYKRYGASGINAPKRTVTNGAWFDDLDNGSAPKMKRSTDIYISHKPIPEEKAQPGVIVEPKSVPISIDILTIEIPDPTTK